MKWFTLFWLLLSVWGTASNVVRTEPLEAATTQRQRWGILIYFMVTCVVYAWLWMNLYTDV